MCGRRVTLLAVLGLASLQWSDSLWLHGEKRVPANSAVFVAKFCYDFDRAANNTGEMNFVLKGVSPIGKNDLKVFLLDDEPGSYPSTRSTWWGISCDDPKLKTIAKASADMDLARKKNRLHSFIVERIRSRYWFVAVLDCSGQDRMIEYDLRMLNIEQGWMQELSMDRCGVFPLTIFLGVYLATALLQVNALFLQSTAKTKHPLRLILTFGVCAALWGMGFFTVDTVWYAMSGENNFLLYLASKLFKVWSKFTLLLILVLLSKGRCISSDLEIRHAVQGASIILPFLIACLGLELWGEYDESRTYTTNFVYDTWVGGLITMLDLALLGYYVSNLLNTYRAESVREKKLFYKTWGLVYSSAFLTIPTAILVGHFVAPWVQVRVTIIVNNTIHVVLLGLLVAGLWPERTQPVFCIDNKNVAACTFGAKSGNLLEMAEGKQGDYQEFSMEEDSMLAKDNI